MAAEKGPDKNDNEKRSYFRIDDVISVVANPVEIEEENSEKFVESLKSSRALPLMSDNDTPNLNPDNYNHGNNNHFENRSDKKMHEMMGEIKTKLDFIINHFMLEKEGLLTAEKKLVNISASGIRFVVKHPVNVNDVLEIKLLLPTYPPVAVFAYGEAKRVKKLDGNKYEVCLKYLNMGESVRNEIIQYTLSHQRETIRKVKESGKNE
jgi:hypothetical protein